MVDNTGHRSRTGSSTNTPKGVAANDQTLTITRSIEVLTTSASNEDPAVILEKTLQLRAQVTEDDAAKDIFRRSGGFEAILAALQRQTWSTNNDREQALVVQSSCLLLIAALDEHRGNLRYFIGRLHGWKTIENQFFVYYAEITKLEDVQVRKTQLKRICDALISLATGEEPQGTIRSDAAIRYAFPCATLLRLAARSMCEKHDKEAFLPPIEAIKQLTATSVSNRVLLWNTSIDSELLTQKLSRQETSAWTESLSDVLQSISIYGLHDLNETARLFDQARTSDNHRSLLLELLRNSKGPAFIHFDLRNYGHSSLELPCLPRSFPPTTGYTLSTWLRFDTFDPKCHTTIFGAFDASQACFVLVYLEKDTHQLILQTSIRSARPSIRFRSTTFEMGRWYHIAIVHRRATQDPKQSPAILFVDGEFAEQVKCSYPEAPQQSTVKEREASAFPVQAFLGTPRDLAMRLGRDQIVTSWSLAAAHLFQTPLTDEFIAVQRRLGPRYAGNFQDCLGPLLTYRASAELNRYNELLHPDKSEQSDIVQATEHRGSDVVAESKILFSFSAKSVYYLDNRKSDNVLLKADLDRKAHLRYNQLAQKATTIAINTAIPSISDAILRPYGTAILAGDPIIALPKPLDEASWSLAGSLPLLYKLLEAASSTQAFLQAVEIFFESIEDNWRISEAIEKSNGFGVLAMVIRQKLGLDLSVAAAAQVASLAQISQLSAEDRQSMPYELLSMILRYVGYDATTPEKSMIVNPMAYRVLLIDFDTWRQCDSRTIELYYTQFTQFVVRNQHQSFNHKRLTRMRCIKRLVDAMKVEDLELDTVNHLMATLRALLQNPAAHTSYKDLAMFVAFGLQDDRASSHLPVRSMASAVRLRQQAASWASRGRSRPSTPSDAVAARRGLSRSQLALHVLQLLADVLCEPSSSLPIRRFVKSVPTRWMSHLLAENNTKVVTLTTRIICQALATLGNDFKHPFVDKNGGFIAMKSRLKAYWRSAELWQLIFAILFGQAPGQVSTEQSLTVHHLLDTINIDKNPPVVHQDVLPVLTSLLEAGLRQVVRETEPQKADAFIISTVIQSLAELYSRCQAFRDYATSSRYTQELLFVLYPVVVGSDRLAADTEVRAEKDSLSFKGEEVVMRPHSNSVGERPPSVRSLSFDKPERAPSPATRRIAHAPRRLSSFVLVNPVNGKTNLPSTRFSSAISPQVKEPVKLNVGNSMVESLLEIVVDLFIDQICNKKDFNGIGLFQKVPPGFREHQAYFESYIIVHTLSQLWSYLQFNPGLLQETKVLTNLGRYAQHLAEAVFEGWFIDGAQPVINFVGKVLEYLQQPHIAEVKAVRLCSQAVNSMRIVFLRVTLLRLSELDESTNEAETVEFLQQMSYWQTILFSSDNQEALFIRLMCFLLYLKLMSSVRAVRVASANLWRTVLMQKPTETATLLTYSVTSEQRHLSTGFMKLVSLDDDDFIDWVDTHRSELDAIFIEVLAKPWADFVSDENRRNEETAKSRLSKRKEKLRLWHAEEDAADQFLHRYETSTSHWRSNVHAQERLKSQRALQDHQEGVSSIYAVLTKIERQLTQPCGAYPSEEEPKWRLDETEGLNRMRMRMLRDRRPQKESFQPKRKASIRSPAARLTVNTQLPRLSQDIVSATPSPGPGRVDEDNAQHSPSRRDSLSSSQLLEGAFEMVEDPKEDEDGVVEDKNRKVLTSLQRGDMVQQLYNVSRIVGLEACEGLLVIGKQCLYLQDNYFQRSDGEIVSVAQAPTDERDPYLQLISGKDVGSQQTKQSTGDHATRHWTWTEVLSISKRRFLLRDVSLEVFFTDGRSYLLTCMTTKTRDELYNAVVSRAPHVHGTTTVASEDAWRLDNLRNPEEAPSTIGSRFATVFSSATTHAATKKWVKGDMSNFQYLMLMNTMAGRTFNDLTQYPVFPWVLADYDSEDLDLDDPKTFRDLRKPMGCQHPAREAEFKDRYKQFAEMSDQSAPAFNYGTHYSSAMIVSSYLIRLQPFVQSYLLLQGGAFDHADRLFDSIGKAWLSASRDNMSDVRELTPEFFYLPEFLTNVNKYDFGTKQGNGGVVNDVRLPRWAKGDPRLFIAKHREALESRYVSENLQHWIDLTFGFRQRGEAAIAATNVFQHLSYGGAKDLDTIDDPVERLATIGIIHSFGQTPHQIFHRPHPARDIDKMASNRLDAHVESLVRLPSPLFESGERVVELAYLQSQERLLCSGLGKLNMLPNCDRFMQWKLSDNSVRFLSTNTKRLVGLYENIHIGTITQAIFADSKTLITAGSDCTIAIWSIKTNRDWIEMQSSTCLSGHRSSVSILSVSRVFSTLLSASEDGHVLLWDLNRQNCLRVLSAAGSGRLQAARISNLTGHVALCRGSDLLLYTLNGELLLRQKICETSLDEISCCAFYEGARNEWVERELLFTGHANGVVNIWSLTSLSDGSWHLSLVNRLNHADSTREAGSNTSASISAILPMAHAVFTGDDLGKVWQWDVLQKQGVMH